MHDRVMSPTYDGAIGGADDRSCVFVCDYVPRNRSWKWTWISGDGEADAPLSQRTFDSLNECLQDAASHGYTQRQISIRYAKTYPNLTLLDKLDDRSRDFIRALKELIPSTKARRRALSPAIQTPGDGAAATSEWAFRGSPQQAASSRSSSSEQPH